MKRARFIGFGLLILGLIGGHPSHSIACTALVLEAQDGSLVYGRTMEWGTFDLNSRISIIPREFEFTGTTPDGTNGLVWTGQYGILGLDMLDQHILGDGMNEAGLVVGLLYHPNIAKYPEYDPALASQSITAKEVPQYLLSQCGTVDEVKKAMKKVRVVPVIEAALGKVPGIHWIVLDASGQCIVIEFLDGELAIFNNPLRVLTNAPEFPWHITNLRNYLGLSPVAQSAETLNGIDLTPIGGGSGMLGLPGDFTPPSRFLRAVAWTQTARPTPDANETVYEVFRIMDNFNVPLGAAEGSGGSDLLNSRGYMRSATIWTLAWDLRNRVLYYHTQNNRMVRRCEMKGIDFTNTKAGIRVYPLDKEKKETIEDVTPRK